MREFIRLADEVSQRAAAVSCSPSAYRDGLSIIIDRLETDREASREMNPDD